MTIGVLTMDLLLDGCQNLKDKRRILNSLKSRLRDNFNVSISEMDHQDKWQRSMFGIACIGIDKKFVNGLLDRTLDFVRASSDVVLSDYRLELL